MTLYRLKLLLISLLACFSVILLMNFFYPTLAAARNLKLDSGYEKLGIGSNMGCVGNKNWCSRYIGRLDDLCKKPERRNARVKVTRLKNLFYNSYHCNLGNKTGCYIKCAGENYFCKSYGGAKCTYSVATDMILLWKIYN